MIQEAEHLPSKCKTLNSNPKYHQKHFFNRMRYLGCFLGCLGKEVDKAVIVKLFLALK
jgi:hypothetical protein